MRRSAPYHTAIPASPGIQTAPTAGSAPDCRWRNRSPSRGEFTSPVRGEVKHARTRSRGGALLHLLPNHAAEREQALVDRGRHFADEFDDAPSVLEDAGLPYQLIAELVDF